MLLRRVIKHFRNQEWTAIAIDFLIVVVGVFIGLQVQEWSGRQAERRLEMQLVADLLADLDFDRSQYTNGLATAVNRVGAANASLVGAGLPPIDFDWQVRDPQIDNYSFDVPEASAYPADQRYRLWTDVVLGFHPTPSTATVDAMVGAGDMKIIRDRALVREIQRYRSRTAVVTVQNEKLHAIRADVLRTGASYGLAPYASMPADEYFRLIASAPELAASIRIMATFVMFHHGDMASANADASGLQARLKNYQEMLQ